MHQTMRQVEGKSTYSVGIFCSSIGRGMRLLGYCPPLEEAGSHVDSVGSCCSCSIGCGIRLLVYCPLQKAGSSVDSDGSCCSCSIGRGLRLLEYRPRQAGSELDLDLDASTYA